MRVHRVAYIVLLQIDDEQCHTQTHPQFEYKHQWLHGQVVLGVNRQPSTTLQNSTPKLAGQNPESISQQAIYRGILARTSSRYQVFEKLLWKPIEDASQGHLGIKCHPQYNMIIRLFQHSSANSYGGDWGCIVHDLDTIIVLVLFAFNFIPLRSYHSLYIALPRSRIIKANVWI